MLIVIALLGCRDEPADPKDPTPVDTDSDLPVVVDTDGPPTPQDTGLLDEPRCDGLDDDGDMLVDEGFPDADSDGRADCVDTCQLIVPPAGPAPYHRCAPEGFTPHPDPWAVEVAWAWRGTASVPVRAAVVMTPVVTQLTDDDGDGDVDRHDRPDVAFVAGVDHDDRYGVLVVLDGATGDTLLELPDVVAGWAQEIGAADVDDDGVPELLVTASDSHQLAIRADGSVTWRSVDRVAWPVRVSVTRVAADVAVLVNQGWYHGASGRLRATARPFDSVWAEPSVADLDGDGLPEWVVGRGLYDGTGARVLVVPGPANSPHTGIAWQVDADPAMELLFATDGGIVAVEPTLGVLWEEVSAGQGAGPFALADLDGDGAREVAFVKGGRPRAVGRDGAIGWDVAGRDPSCCAGVVAADLDGDGAAEVITADERDVRVLSGRTGRELLRVPEHDSQTATETVAVADLDGDGSAELLYGSNASQVPSGVSGLTALRHPDRGWTPSSRGWFGHAHDAASVREDGRVVVSPETGVRATRGVREADTWAVTEAPHHHVALLSSCPDGLRQTAVVQVSNRGGRPAPAATLRLVRRAAGGDTVLDTRPVPSLGEGEALPGWTLTVDAADFASGELSIELIGGQTACGPPQGTVAWSP